MIMRLKGRPPHPDWPVQYPVVCSQGETRCPTRQINDVENYLLKIIYDFPPALLTAGTRMYFDEPFFQRHLKIYEPDSENEEDHTRVYPAVWMPPQVPEISIKCLVYI